MPKDVERCQKLLKDVERCQKMLKDVKRCQKMSKDVEKSRKMSKNLDIRSGGGPLISVNIYVYEVIFYLSDKKYQTSYSH